MFVNMGSRPSTAELLEVHLCRGVRVLHSKVQAPFDSRSSGVQVVRQRGPPPWGT